MTLRLSYSKIKDSFKEIKLNKILDKIYKNEDLSQHERNFLTNFEKDMEDLYNDYKLLTKEIIFGRVKNLLELGKTVICNLYDNDGKIGQPITEISNSFQGECVITIKKGEKIKLPDNFLYNILYIKKKDHFSLEVQDEFYEEIIKD